MKTVAKTSKRAQAIIAAATAITVYSEDNYFSGQAIEDDEAGRESMVRWLNVMHRAKLIDEGDGTYRVRVHGNHWYEFRTA